MAIRTRASRELEFEAAQDLDGIWVAAGFGDAAAAPTPLGWELVEDDARLLGRALSERGASLPRLSRRFTAVDGHAFHAFGPLVDAARELVPLDAAGLALALAGEAREDARRRFPARREASTLALSSLAHRASKNLRELEQRVVHHERDASHHYRWLVEMDLGILPDDALGTTLEECVAIQRASRALEIEATLDLIGAYAGLSSLAERALSGSVGQLVAAAILPDPLELASATPALALTSLAAVVVDRDSASDPRAVRASLDEFRRGFGERGPREREPFVPRWRELPETLERLVLALGAASAGAVENRVSGARRERDQVVERAIAAFGAIDATLFRSLLTTARKIVILRSRLHRVRADTLAMLRITALDIDRRLSRLIGSDPGSAFFLALGELIASTARPNSGLAALARARRARWSRAERQAAPPALLGRDVVARDAAAPIAGVGLGDGEISGVAVVASDFDAALALPAGGVLVTRSLDAGWAPLLPLAAAVITDTGGLLDEGVLAASSLGVPLVLGARDATRRIANGDVLRVDARAGTVAPVAASGVEPVARPASDRVRA